MTKPANTKIRPGVSGTQKHLVQQGTAVSEVLTSALRNIQLIQSNAGAEIFTRNLDSWVPALSPGGGAPYWFQQIPRLYSAQAAALMKSAADTFNEWVQAQQTLMEMGSQSSWPGVNESAEATTQALRKFYSRRVTAEVISFPDRRAA
ncbi:hypothetical protein [Rhodoferax sp. PAMC 29310]|uniref:hypothetical protein n=1 Tax=Rhodoferax sp. PAMC 29310 TaxID=2822760 RepID=UPI001B34445C|nr:hypothetical protein [Rhodoferax sp. PAMC 29310]